ncbi:ZmpA/ZmpB/ZmpC family metallo-endopeptidase [Abiotrophia defectiva]|uniref:ZmpA/ZmpB/ZmpC family metallo-endopeptidase n=1 Tax=Abiotrophia defectiva TaxID=46125 RepID=UPI0028ED01CC|nr:ZmpA/ZmpB/ZmpC family metallo-endopeptidase [Abiotrophia defectiva]
MKKSKGSSSLTTVQRFSIRKFSVGIASVVIGSFFVSALIGPTVNAQAPTPVTNAPSTPKSVTTEYRYVSIEELNWTQRQAIKSGTPNQIAQADQVYYFVYQPSPGTRQLPVTGESSALLGLAASATLIVFAVGLVRDKKKAMTSLMVVTMAGQVLLSPSLQAIEAHLLQDFNQSYQLPVGQTLPNPKIEIEGYEYLGYLTTHELNQSVASVSVASTSSESESRKYSVSSEETSSVEMSSESSSAESSVQSQESESRTSVESSQQPSESSTAATPTPQPEESSSSATPTPTPQSEESSSSTASTPAPQSEESSSSVASTPTPRSDESSSSAASTPTPQPEESSSSATPTPVPQPEETSSSVEPTPPPQPEESSSSATPTPQPEPTPEPPKTLDYTKLERTLKTANDQLGALSGTALVGKKPSTIKSFEERVAQVKEKLKNLNNQAQELKGQPDTTEQATIDALAQQVQDLVNLSTNLADILVDQADKSPLETAMAALAEQVKTAKALDLSDKTPSSQQALADEIRKIQATLQNAQSVVKDPEVSDVDVEAMTRSVVNQAKSLEAAIKALQAKADTKALAAALALLDAPVDTDQKTPQSIANYQQALDSLRDSLEATRAQAQAILSDPEAKQEQVDKTLIAVNEVQAKLDQAKALLRQQADKSALEKAKNNLDQAIQKPVVTDQKRPKTVQTYQAAKDIALQLSQEAAQLLKDLNASPEEVLASTEKVNKAFQQLELAEAGILDLVDKADLQRALTQLNLPVDTTGKTPRSVNDFSQALAGHQATIDQAKANAQALIDNQDATPEEVVSAIEAVKAAQVLKDQAQALLMDRANKEALGQQVEAAQAVDANRYTPASFQKVADQLKAAQAVLEDGDSKQEAVDQATQALREALAQLEQVEPKYTAVNVESPASDLSRSVTVRYQLEDPNQLYRGGKVQVFQGDRLVKTVPIQDLTASIDGLDYHVPYRLHTVMDYVNHQGAQSKDQLEDQVVELDLKKLELKQIKGVQLFHRQADGSHQLMASLSQIPSDLSNYYVKVQSDRFKDVYLPVASIETVSHDGQSYYQVTTQAPELVQNQGGSSDYHQGYQFLVGQERPADGNVHYSFKSLLEAIRQNPAGDYILGANLSASEVSLAANATAYFVGTFTGTLSGQTADGTQHAIYNLVAPLFDQLNQATIKHLDLKQVAIESGNSIAALAKRATNSTISDVAVSGRVSGTTNVAGIVHTVVGGSRLENVRFQGEISQSGQPNQAQEVGGLVGLLEQSSVTNAYVDAKLNVNLNAQSTRAGVAFGRVVSSQGKAVVKNVLVKGSLTNTGSTVQGRSGGQVGGVVGSTWMNGRLENIISDVGVTNGYRVYGDNGAISEGYIRNDQVAWKMTERVTGVEEPSFKPAKASQADVDKLASQLEAAGGVLTDTPASSYVDQINQQATDYSRLANYQASRAQAYANMEKLLPFYNKEQIVKYGNLVAPDSKLATRVLLAVTPMQGNAFVTDYNQAMDRIMLHFADKSVQYLALGAKSEFKQTGVVEYQLEDSGLIYTPNQVLKSVDDVMNAVLDIMKETGLSSDAVWQAAGVNNLYTDVSARVKNDRRTALENKLGRSATEEEIAEDLEVYRREQRAYQIETLFFNATFGAFQDTLANDLVKIIRQEANYLGDNEQARAALIQKLKDNRGALLLGLAYLQDHYRVNFGDLNLGEIATYQTDFFGNQKSIIDKLIQIGSQGIQPLRSVNSAKTYNRVLSSDSKLPTVLDYLSYFRELWTKFDQYEWFRDATKANVTMEERPSLEEGLNKSPYKVYDRLSVPDYRDYILPLLNLKKSRIFLVSNVLSLTLGSTDRRPNLTPEEFDRRVKALADRQQMHVDTWYRVALPAVKDRMARKNAMLIWDGYANGKNGGWYDGLGNDTSNKPVKYPSMGIKEFFGRIGRVYGNNGAGAYADTNNGIYFVFTDILEDYIGTSHYTHEVVHNMERSVYLGGNGWRPEEVWEEYAQGLLQSPEGPEFDHIGLNTSFDWSDKANRLYNATPSRFQSADDWGQYVHRLFDILYLLDYAEAKAVLEKGPDAMKQWFNRFINVPNGPNHVNNKVVEISDEEWTNFNIQSIDDFIDRSLAPKRYFRNGFETDRNSYERINMFHPMYGTGQNDKGSPGGWWFKRMAWELMGYKGYKDGFIPYASNQLERQARTDGQTLNDNYIIQKVSNGEFQDLNAFKKAMFKERLDKVANGATLRPITVRDRQVSTLADIEALMKEAVDRVLSARQTGNMRNDVYNLKREIYLQLFKASDDFRQSIFANE